MKRELCTDAAALAVDGTPPQMGDAIEAKIAGTVTRVDGDRVYFSADTANGAPIHDDEAATETEPGNEEDALRGQAAAYDATEEEARL